MAYKDPKKAKEYQKQWWQKNKNKMKEYKKKWKNNNPEKYQKMKKQCNQKFYQKNREKLINDTKIRYQKNRKEILEYKQKYRQSERYKYWYKEYKKQWLRVIEGHYGKIACSVCGYNRNFASIEFHHPKPEEKEKRIPFHVKPTAERQEKLFKCQMLCSNCHREIHHPECSLIKNDEGNSSL